MNTHSHKEPPLRYKVKHNNAIMVNILYGISYAILALLIGITFAGVFDA